MLEATSLRRALDLLGRVLGQRGYAYDLVAVGGSALLLLEIIRRPTQDLDVIAVIEHGHFRSANPLPDPLRGAARDVAAALGIGQDWVDTRPASLLDLGLPGGFADRMVVLNFGALTIHLASRLDQIYFKVYAAADQGPASKHFDDLKTLAPTRDELLAAARWTRMQDPSQAFRGELIGLLEALGVGHAADVV